MLQEIKKRARKATNNYSVKRTHVQSNLALTPSEMMSLSERGIPISSHFDDSQFYDGDNSPRVELAFEHQRGIDINDAWNAERNAKKNIRNAIVNDIKNSNDL